MSERIAIVGSRNFPTPDLVRKMVSNLPAGSIIVSGGARGVDSWAEAAAGQRGVKTLIFHADWDGLGRKARHIRNEEILTNADRVIAFWDRASRGTLHTLVMASRAGLPFEVFDPDGRKVSEAEIMEAADRLGVLASIEKAELRRR